MKIVLVKMGMDLYGGDELKSDMKAYRVRPTLDGDCSADGCLIKDRDGHYIAGDFMFWGKNKTNNTECDRLTWEFTDYGTDKKDMKRYSLVADKPLAPTIENIKKMMRVITGQEIEIEWAER